MKPTTNKPARRQPWRQPPTMLGFAVVPLAFAAGVLFLGWLISG